MLLDGAGTGQPGTNFVTSVTKNNLAGSASQRPTAAIVRARARELIIRETGTPQAREVKTVPRRARKAVPPKRVCHSFGGTVFRRFLTDFHMSPDARCQANLAVPGTGTGGMASGPNS